jgi:nitrite reductase/ring-hydroxylating ferredoxin subunit
MEWVRIFSSEQEARRRILNHKPQLVAVYGKRICLTLHDNNFFAVQDACSHNGESLSKGHINHLGEIVCPWHGYRFELQTGRPCDSSSPDLATYPIKIDESGFYIGIP